MNLVIRLSKRIRTLPVAPWRCLETNSSAVRLESPATGGFNALVKGARFTSGDLTANVVVTSPEPRSEGESPPLAAILELGSEALGTQRIEGEWTCGP